MATSIIGEFLAKPNASNDGSTPWWEWAIVGGGASLIAVAAIATFIYRRRNGKH